MMTIMMNDGITLGFLLMIEFEACPRFCLNVTWNLDMNSGRRYRGESNLVLKIRSVFSLAGKNGCIYMMVPLFV